MLLRARGRLAAEILSLLLFGASAACGSTARGSPDASIDEPDAHPLVQVTMNANDPSGFGANPHETFLNVNTVSASTFGKLFALPVDGDQYPQPLYLGGLAFKDGTTKNVVFVATSNDSVYAFDADKEGDPIWKVSVGTPSPMPNPYVGNNIASPTACQSMNRFMNELGVTATPVLDPATGTLYVLAIDVDSSVTIPDWTCVHVDASKPSTWCLPYSCTAPTFRYRLHALDVLTGKERSGSPVTIDGSVAGLGGGSQGGQIAFDSMTELARTGLLLANGNLYFSFASYSDLNVYHGWVFAYDATTFKRVGQFCDTSDGTLGGIWQSGRSLLSDGTYVYVVTGNGTFDANNGGQDYGDSVIKLNADLTKVEDYFSPYLTDFDGVDFLTTWDDDLTSAGGTMIPGTTLLLVSGKLGNGYLLDRGNLGKWNKARDKVVQKIRLAWKPEKTTCTNTISEAIVNSTPVAWSGPDATRLYVWASNDYLREYKLDKNGQFSSQGVCFCSPNWVVPAGNGNADLPADPPCGVADSKGSVEATVGGGALSISSNGTESGTGILWATHAPTGYPYGMSSPGVIEAYDATNVQTPLWSSATNSRDGLGNWAKFTPPTVANGKVYVPTFSNQLLVYGILATH
jgi:hypothetical protein